MSDRRKYARLKDRIIGHKTLLEQVKAEFAAVQECANHKTPERGPETKIKVSDAPDLWDKTQVTKNAVKFIPKQ